MYLEDQKSPNKVRRMATGFLSDNGEANVQNTSRQNFEEKQREEENDKTVKGHTDNEDKEDDHDSEVLISVKVTSTDDDILVQY